MPIYTYFCPKCCEKRDAFRKIDERNDAPVCHGRRMQRLVTPPMIAVFNPYRAVAFDKESGERPLIRTRGEHEAFLRRNGYEEVGNDTSMAPLPQEEVVHRRKQKLKEQADAGPAPDFEFDPDTHHAQA